MSTPTAAPAAAPGALRRRLLNDIAEVQRNPYPNIHLYPHEADVTRACLVLIPPQEEPLHLSIHFWDDYPLRAPRVSIQSAVTHPNVYGSYICASILNTDEGWTPAYTLKGILIQLLSFFSSESIEQDYGGSVNLKSYKQSGGSVHWFSNWGDNDDGSGYRCETCGFGSSWKPPKASRRQQTSPVSALQARGRSKLFELPDEVVLSLMSFMETADVMSFADAVPSIRHILHSYDFIRIRELQCFCLKKSFLAAKLGIGVSISGGKRPVLRSEFDLVSQEAFFQHGVRRSIQGVPFDRWLPLPLSRRHWNAVRRPAALALDGLRFEANMEAQGRAGVLFSLMTTVVVQFSEDADRSFKQPDARSTLSHASEKAVEAYFALFHLLLCIATDDASVVPTANRTVAAFLAGPRSKARFPDLGHVLVAALISDGGLSENLIFHIIKEAVLRNVVWMLDTQGAAMAELAYLEPSSISDYRLTKTFEASTTSYRLLMFLKLFSSMARGSGRTLAQLRDTLFETHGAPPAGTSVAMAQQIRHIRDINSFPKFLSAMGITAMPNKTEFTAFLRRTIGESVDAGYSVMPMTQSQLYMLRRAWEPNVPASEKVRVTPELERWYADGERWYANGWDKRPSFFPGRGGRRENGSGNGRGGGPIARGRGRGRPWRPRMSGG